VVLLSAASKVQFPYIMAVIGKLKTTLTSQWPDVIIIQNRSSEVIYEQSCNC